MKIYVAHLFIFITILTWSFNATAELGPTLPDHQKTTVVVKPYQTYIIFRYQVDEGIAVLDPYGDRSYTASDGTVWRVAPAPELDVTSVPNGHGIVFSPARGEWIFRINGFSQSVGNSMCAAFQDDERNYVKATIYEHDKNFACHMDTGNVDETTYDGDNSYDFALYSSIGFPLAVPTPNNATKIVFAPKNVEPAYTYEEVEFDAFLRPSIITKLKIYQGDPPGSEEVQEYVSLVPGEWTHIEIEFSLADAFLSPPLLEKYLINRVFLDNNPIHDLWFQPGLLEQSENGNYILKGGFMAPDAKNGVFSVTTLMDSTPISPMPNIISESPKIELSNFEILSLDVAQNTMNPRQTKNYPEFVTLIPEKKAAAVVQFSVPIDLAFSPLSYTLNLYVGVNLIESKTNTFSSSHRSQNRENIFKELIEFFPPADMGDQPISVAIQFGDQTVVTTDRLENLPKLRSPRDGFPLNLSYVKVSGCKAEEPCYRNDANITAVRAQEQLTAEVFPISAVNYIEELPPIHNANSNEGGPKWLGLMEDFAYFEYLASVKMSENSDRLVVVVPEDYFVHHKFAEKTETKITGAFGATGHIFGFPLNFVIVADVTKSLLPHELAHSFGQFREGYIKGEAESILPLENGYNPATGTYWDVDWPGYPTPLHSIMSADDQNSNGRWIDSETYEAALNAIYSDSDGSLRQPVFKFIGFTYDGEVKSNYIVQIISKITEDVFEGNLEISLKDETGTKIYSIFQNGLLDITFANEGADAVNDEELIDFLKKIEMFNVNLPVLPEAKTISVTLNGATEFDFDIPDLALDPILIRLKDELSNLSKSDLKKPWMLRKYLLNSSIDFAIKLESQGKTKFLYTDLKILKLGIMQWVQGTKKNELLTLIEEAIELYTPPPPPKPKKKPWWKRFW